MKFLRQGPLYIPQRETVRRYVPQDLYRYQRYLERHQQPQLAFSLVVSTGAQSTNSTSVTTSGVDTTGANLIVLGVVNASSVSDSKSNTWTPLRQEVVTGSLNVRQFYAYNPTVGTGHTFTNSDGSPIFPAIAVLAFSGSASSPFDQENGNNNVFVSTLQTGSVTPSTNDQVLTTMLTYNEAGTLSINSGFTISNQGGIVSGQSWGYAMAYKIQTSSGAENPTWSGMSSAEVAATIATFKSAAAGARKFILSSPA